MGNYELLKAAINEVIKANGRQEITGEVLNQVLLSMVNSLGAGYQCMGVATPSTNPGTPDQNVFYFATQAGTYTNFDAIVLQAGISVLIWDGDWASQTWFTVDSEPTNNSQNLIASGAVFNALKLDGGAYDVTAHNSGATFASLSALLNSSNLATLIPTEIRHGGMSIKFVQSSDNKYVKFFCMAQNFTTDVTQWQGVDDYPTAESENLVESGGVYEYTEPTRNNLNDYISIEKLESFNFALDRYLRIIYFTFIKDESYLIEITTANPVKEFRVGTLDDNNQFTNDKSIGYTKELNKEQFVFKASVNSNKLGVYSNPYTGQSGVITIYRCVKTDKVNEKVNSIINNSKILRDFFETTTTTGYVTTHDFNFKKDKIYLLKFTSLIDADLQIGTLDGNNQFTKDNTPIYKTAVNEGTFIFRASEDSDKLGIFSNPYAGNSVNVEIYDIEDKNKYKGVEVYNGTINSYRYLTELRFTFKKGVKYTIIVSTTSSATVSFGTLNSNNQYTNDRTPDYENQILNNVEYTFIASEDSNALGLFSNPYSGQIFTIKILTEIHILKGTYNTSLKEVFDFNGKSGIFFGDSITKGTSFRDNIYDSAHLYTITNNYVKTFCDIVGATFLNKGINGAPYKMDNADCMENQIIGAQSIISNYDFLVVAGGTNDWALGVELDYFRRSVVSCFNRILNLFNGPVYIISPINYSATDTSGGDNHIEDLNSYRQILWEEAEHFRFNFVDASKIFLNTKKDNLWKYLLSDGVHPTETGYYLYGSILAKKLTNLPVLDSKNTENECVFTGRYSDNQKPIWKYLKKQTISSTTTQIDMGSIDSYCSKIIKIDGYVDNGTIQLPLNYYHADDNISTYIYGLNIINNVPQSYVTRTLIVQIEYERDW